MAAMVRITINRGSYDPSDNELLAGYDDKFRTAAAEEYEEAGDLGLASQDDSDSSCSDEEEVCQEVNQEIVGGTSA